MKLSPSLEVESLYTPLELEKMVEIINHNGVIRIDDGTKYPDDGKNRKLAGKLIAKWIDIEIDMLLDLQQILMPKLTQFLGRTPVIQDVHMLESHHPYLIHNDTHSVRGLNYAVKEHLRHLEMEYTIIIPIQTYDSRTVVFNEAFEDTNDFEVFKTQYDKELSIKIDKRIILDHLTHLQPSDFKYLTLKSMHPWVQGSMFAIDCRYFHCSDNFLKKGVASKSAIVIRTLRSKE
jgi:hypothetical protein